MNDVGIAARLTRHDDIYERLVTLHEGLSHEESHKLNAKLILALANQVGDAGAVLALIDTISGQSTHPPKERRGQS